MSDTQLMKLREERDALQREAGLLKNAQKPSEAAEKIVAHIRKAEDPFCSPADNEWASAADKGGCCVVQ